MCRVRKEVEPLRTDRSRSRGVRRGSRTSHPRLGLRTIPLAPIRRGTDGTCRRSCSSPLGRARPARTPGSGGSQPSRSKPNPSLWRETCRNSVSSSMSSSSSSCGSHAGSAWAVAFSTGAPLKNVSRSATISSIATRRSARSSATIGAEHGCERPAFPLVAELTFSSVGAGVDLDCGDLPSARRLVGLCSSGCPAGALARAVAANASRAASFGRGACVRVRVSDPVARAQRPEGGSWRARGRFASARSEARSGMTDSASVICSSEGARERWMGREELIERGPKRRW